MIYTGWNCDKRVLLVICATFDAISIYFRKTFHFHDQSLSILSDCRGVFDGK